MKKVFVRVQKSICIEEITAFMRPSEMTVIGCNAYYCKPSCHGGTFKYNAIINTY